ncbi:uncharacterized protein LOC129755545 [Uranotaenia lowii]|uniref:uncharacterized protein LOC129755545 n=1 Tax=Uranotaenia lowii TaxID=190385 RepID=UPI00247A2403|nr:uncharacterized protein LOC129755545 [Uranotaenia lowii]
MLAFIFLTFLTQTLTLQIQRLDQPIFIYDVGIGRIQYQSNYYIHHFNIKTLKTYITDLKEKFNKIEINQFTEIIQEKFDEINYFLENIIPIRRQKRWDTVGTVWKFIAGTPDANDLRLINSSINNLIVNNNKQVKINREISLQLKESFFKTKEAIQLFESKATELFSINIFFNLKRLGNQIENILETIMLARLGILNEKILSKNEIETLRKDLERENVTVYTSSEVITYATTSIATNRQEMVLLIKMPKLDPRIFRKIHVYPIIHNRQQILTDNRIFLVHPTAKFMVKTSEQTIYDIKDTEIADSSCIPNLLDEKAAICNYTSNPMQQDIIPLDMQHILVNSETNFTLSSDCATTDRTLTGSYLIQYENCTIRINNIVYTSKTQNITGKPLYLPLDGISITKNGEILNLSLSHLHKLQKETRNELDLLRLENNSLSFPHWSIIGGIAVLPTLIGIAILFSFFFHRTTNIKLHTTSPETTPDVGNQVWKTERGRKVTNFRKLTLSDVMTQEAQL